MGLKEWCEQRYDGRKVRRGGVGPTGKDPNFHAEEFLTQHAIFGALFEDVL